MSEQKYTQYTMLFYSFLILQAYKTLKGHEFWSLLLSKMLFHVWNNHGDHGNSIFLYIIHYFSIIRVVIVSKYVFISIFNHA